MIDQQSGISLESLLRGILGIVTVLAVAYALSYDRKRIDWKLIGGGLIMQVIFCLLYTSRDPRAICKRLCLCRR